MAGLRHLSGGLWAAPQLRGGARYLYGVRGGRISFVAVAARGETTSARQAQRELAAAGL
jgi:hypothetical protein